MITTTQLEQIFEHQAQLAAKFAPNSVTNGYPLFSWPLDPNDRRSQDHIREYAWWIAEEMGEALIVRDHHHEAYSEELADVLHFQVELCLMLGITPSMVLNHARSEFFQPAIFLPSIQEVFIELIKGINLLKAKPWKLNPAETNQAKLMFHVGRSLHYLLHLFHFEKLNAYDLYFAKKKVNEQRIQSGL